jgi:hypothetical protein
VSSAAPILEDIPDRTGYSAEAMTLTGVVDSLRHRQIALGFPSVPLVA